MNALIIANGDPPSESTAKRLILTHDLLIAADGGIRAVLKLGLVPDLLTGDFDSVKLDEIHKEYPGLKVINTADQNRTDLEKAVVVAGEFGATAVTIIAATGGRVDHTLGNISLLLTAEPPVCLADDFGTLQAVCCIDGCERAVTLRTAPGDTVSLVTFEASATVSIAGVKWPLTEFNLAPGTLGVSNLALGDTVKVSVHRGSVFLCHLHEESVRRHSQIPQHSVPKTFQPET